MFPYTANDYELVEIRNERKLSDDEVMILARIAIIQSKDTSEILTLLVDSIPLQLFGLGHLKRARKMADGRTTEVLLSPWDYRIDSSKPIEAQVLSKCISFREALVCRLPPETREEFNNWGRSWPTHFYPHGEMGLVGSGAGEIEPRVSDVCRFMQLAWQDELRYRCTTEPYGEHQHPRGAVIVDPLLDAVSIIIVLFSPMHQTHK